MFFGTRSFFTNRLKELVPPLVASMMTKFEQILWERFGNILKQSFKGHKNSGETCYRHNWLISKENDEVWKCSFISWWFDSILNCVRKKTGIALAEGLSAKPGTGSVHPGTSPEHPQLRNTPEEPPSWPDLASPRTPLITKPEKKTLKYCKWIKKYVLSVTGKRRLGQIEEFTLLNDFWRF